MQQIKTQDQIIQEAYLSEVVHPAEVAQLEQDVKRTGKSHSELADAENEYADRMERIGQKSLAIRSRMIAKQHAELANIK